jgi:signal peptidase I
MTLPRALALAITAVFIAVAGVAAYGWANGVRFYAVESGSMAPAFGQGDLVIDTPTSPATVFRVGDVITFHPTAGYTTTHRIIAVDATGISTQGDANQTADIGQIQAGDVIGIVVGVVPFGGYVAMFFRQPAGIAALIGVMVVLYLAWELLFARKPGSPAGAHAAASVSEHSGGEPG